MRAVRSMRAMRDPRARPAIAVPALSTLSPEELERRRRADRDRQWAGASEWVIREEMEAAVRRRFMRG